MTTLTKQQAQQLGLMPLTSAFRTDIDEDRDLLEKMFSDIRSRNNSARIVSISKNNVRIEIKQKPRYGSNRPDNPKALRGENPPPCRIVGRA